MKEIGLIGDVHGCLAPLRELVERASEKANKLVFLGDYVNRGPESRQVVEFLINLQADSGPTVHFLRGNHDRAFQLVLNGDPIDNFLRMGGAPTVRSYIRDPFGDVATQLRRSAPRSHYDFFANLDDSFAEGDLYAAHDAHTAPNDARYVVSGHTVQPQLLPFIDSARAYIDTGCGTAVGGRLTCLYWPSLDWEQSEARHPRL